MKQSVKVLPAAVVLLLLPASSLALASNIPHLAPTMLSTKISSPALKKDTPHLGIVKALVFLNVKGRFEPTTKFLGGQKAHMVLAWTMTLHKNSSLPKSSGQVRVAKAANTLYLPTMRGRAGRTGGSFSTDLRLTIVGKLTANFTLRVDGVTIQRSVTLTVRK